VPSGDRSRSWFPEMIDRLRETWRAELGVDDLIALAQSLDRLLQDIRTKRGIRPPTILCRKCGKRGPAAAPRISVRATILAAERFGFATMADVKELERRWKSHRSKEGLDLYGRFVGAVDRGRGANPNGCSGHASRAGEP